jgi:hypothetical protein
LLSCCNYYLRNGNDGKKRTAKLTFPVDVLDMSPYVKGDDADYLSLYELVAVAQHFESNPTPQQMSLRCGPNSAGEDKKKAVEEKGHYKAVCRNIHTHKW